MLIEVFDGPIPTIDDEIKAISLLKENPRHDKAFRVLAPALRLTLWRYIRAYSTVIPKEEMAQLTALGILRAVQTYDPTICNRFYTYAQHWVKNYIVNERNALRKSLEHGIFLVSTSESVFSDKEGDSVIDTLVDENANTAQDYEDRDTAERLRHLVKEWLEVANFRTNISRRYMTCIVENYIMTDRMDLKAIAQHLGVTHQRISQVLNKFQPKLQIYIKNNWDKKTCSTKS